MFTPRTKYAEAIKEEAEVAKTWESMQNTSKLPLPFLQNVLSSSTTKPSSILKFISSIIQGLKIYEKTKVLRLMLRSMLQVHGRKNKARHIVFATGFLNYTPAIFFTHASKGSYLLALEIQSDSPQLDGMYLMQMEKTVLL